MAKTSISPPFLELSFYRSEHSNHENLCDLVVALLDYSASFLGIATVQTPSRPHSPFSKLYETPSEHISLTTLAELEVYRDDPDRRLAQIYMTKIKGLATGNPALLTLLSHRSERSYGLPAPIALWVAGDAFSHAPGKPDPRAPKIARVAYRCFKFLVEHFRPDYANITVEVVLSTPLEGDSLDFLDCYVSHRVIPAEQLLACAPSNTFIESVAEGHIIFSYDWARKWRPLAPSAEKYPFGNDIARLIATSPYYPSVG